MARDTCVVFGKSGGVGPFFRFCFSERPAPAKKLFSPVFLTEKYSISGFRLRVRLRHRSSSRQPGPLKPPTRKKANAQPTHSSKVKCATSNTARARFLPRFLGPRRLNPFSSSAKPSARQRLANPEPCKNKGGGQKKAEVGCILSHPLSSISRAMIPAFAGQPDPMAGKSQSDHNPASAPQFISDPARTVVGVLEAPPTTPPTIINHSASTT